MIVCGNFPQFMFDKFGKILQLNRSFKKKDFNKANYIAENVSENVLERLHVSLITC
jgi:hypothetical protein